MRVVPRVQSFSAPEWVPRMGIGGTGCCRPRSLHASAATPKVPLTEGACVSLPPSLFFFCPEQHVCSCPQMPTFPLKYVP